MRILIIEDEPELVESLEKGLRIKGYSVDCCKDGFSGYIKATTEAYELIILDLNLPQMDGFEILKKIRQQNVEVKVLILSANNQVESKVRGFDEGTNDYLTKPFHFAELEARIRSLIRRKFVQENNIIRHKEIALDSAKREVTVQNRVLKLTAKELAILEYFLLNRERVITQQELIEQVWDDRVDVFSNSIRVHLSALRKKIKNELGYDPIKTKIGEGYIL